MNITLDSTAFSAAPPAGDGTIHVHALTSTDELVAESLARIYGGMHYRNSIKDGSTLGRSVGRWSMRITSWRSAIVGATTTANTKATTKKAPTPHH